MESCSVSQWVFSFVVQLEMRLQQRFEILEQLGMREQHHFAIDQLRFAIDQL
jgi:hypothetical protein